MQPKEKDEGFNQLCTSEFPVAFVLLLPVSVTVKCKVIELNTPLFRRPVGIMFVKNFPFIDAMTLQYVNLS